MSNRRHIPSQAVSGKSFIPVRAGLLQRKCACGGAAGLTGACAEYSKKRLVSRPPLIQAKLVIGEPGDRYEKEADRVAEQVMRMTMPGPDEDFEEIRTAPAQDEQLRRQPVEEKEEEEEELLQAKEITGRAPAVTPDLASRIQALRGVGRPLPESARAFFEPRFGHDFGRVRVYADSPAAEAARAVDARAFTVGCDVVFGASRYKRNEVNRLALPAEGLIHVLQQKNNAVAEIHSARGRYERVADGFARLLTSPPRIKRSLGRPALRTP